MVSANQFLRVFSRSQLWIFLPLYLYLQRNVPYMTIGILFFLMSVLSLPFTLYGGRFIDRNGPKKAIIISNASLSAILVMLFFTVLYNSNLYYLYFILICTEPFMNILGSADNVIVSQHTSSSQRTAAFSMVRIFQNAGFSLGPAIGGFVALLSYSYVFLIPAVSSIIELIIYILYLEETKITGVGQNGNIQAKFYAAFRNRNFFMISILIALFFVIMGQWGTTLTLFWRGYDSMTTIQVGMLYSVNGIVVTLGQIPTNRLIAGLSDIARINLGYLLYLFSFSILPFFTGFSFLVVDTVIITLGENIITPSINSVISRASPPEARGQYFTSFQALTGLVAPSAPVLGTFLLTVFSSNMGMMWYPLTIIGTIFFIGFIPIWKKIRLYEN